jgi:hypothetical protein
MKTTGDGSNRISIHLNYFKEKVQLLSRKTLISERVGA